MMLLQLVVVSYTDAFEDIANLANSSTPADPSTTADSSTPADTAINNDSTPSAAKVLAVNDGESGGAAGLSLSVENKER